MGIAMKEAVALGLGAGRQPLACESDPPDAGLVEHQSGAASERDPVR